MPQKSVGKKVPGQNTFQFTQKIVSIKPPQIKSLPSNQRVLILSTPIKLKDGTVNIEQRAIPLRINNNQLTLKQSNEPPPLALSINELNKKSTTFVKNEVGQVMGKLIPLGKFSNITPTNLSPLTPAVVPPLVTNPNLKCDVPKSVSKSKESTPTKSGEEVKPSPIASNEIANAKQVVKLKANPSQNVVLNPISGTQSTTIPKPTVSASKSGSSGETSTTATTTKPKKEVHLVLGGTNNMARIGQTGTNIKLIPLEQWKGGAKLDELKRTNKISQQAKVDGIENFLKEEIGDNNNPPYFDESKLQCTIKEENYSINDILEKDPLTIEDVTMEEDLMKSECKEGYDPSMKEKTTIIAEMMDVSISNSTDSTGPSKNTEITTNENVSDVVTVESSIKCVDIQLIKENLISSRSEGSKSEKEEPRVCKSGRTTSDSEISTKKLSAKRKKGSCERLFEQFNMTQSKVTRREVSMIAYIRSLWKRLFYSQSTNARMLIALEGRQRHRGVSHLTATQRCFIQSQLRNSRKLVGRLRFTKREISVARDILKAVGLEGYNNLRKLFYLPPGNVVTNT